MREIKSHCFLSNLHIFKIISTIYLHLHNIIWSSVCKIFNLISFCFSLSVTEASDCFVVIVCLLVLVVHQVFAKPIDSLGGRTSMDHSLEETLRSPCREQKIPMQEDHNEANIKGILQVIKRQSAIAKNIAREDVKEYVSRFFPFQTTFFCKEKINFHQIIE